MESTLLVHAVAAGLGLLFGSVALSSAKGARLHRKAGILFVYAMLVMSLTGAAMAALAVNVGNVVAGVWLWRVRTRPAFRSAVRVGAT